MNLKKKLLTTGLVAVMSLGFATGALAHENVKKHNVVSATIKAGEFSIETQGVDSFGEIEIEPDVKTYYTSLKSPVTVTDLRGTGEGWTVTVSATPFTLYDGEAMYSLPTGSITLDGVESIGGRIGGEYFLGDITDDMDGVLKARTVIDDGEVLVLGFPFGGMGEYDIYFPEDAVSLTIDPFTAHVGEYESVITWTLYSTPQFNDVDDDNDDADQDNNEDDDNDDDNEPPYKVH